MSLWIIIFIIITLVLISLSKKKIIFYGWLGILIVGGINNVISIVSFKGYPVTSISIIDTLTYQLVGFKSCKAEPKHENWLKLAEKIKEPYRLFFYKGIGWGFTQQEFQKEPQRLKEIDRLIKKRSYKDFFYEGLGWGLCWLYEGKIEEIIPYEKYVKEEFRGKFYEGMGTCFSVSVIRRNFKRVINAANKVPLRYKEDFYRGFGRAIGQYCGIDLLFCEDCIDKTEKRFKSFIYEGLGFRISWRFKKDCSNLLISKIDEPFREDFLRGYYKGLRLAFCNDS